MQKIVKLWDQKQPENKKNKLKVATEQNKQQQLSEGMAHVIITVNDIYISKAVVRQLLYIPRVCINTVVV